MNKNHIMRCLLFIAFLSFSLLSFSQESKDVSSTINDSIFNFYTLEKKPQFLNGDEYTVVEWIASHARYPDKARRKEIQGRVFVGFIVEKDGSVSNVKVLRGVSPLLDKEAIGVVKAMPKWKPGMQKGKPVRVSFQVPINFKL